MTDHDGSPSSIISVLLRFPTHSRTIRRLMVEDETFRGIVEDFNLAANTLINMKNRTPVNLDRLKEYTRLVTELEAEIGGYLTAREGKGP